MHQTLMDFGYRPSARSSARKGEEIIVDLFAGGGGASSGIEAATGRAVDVAINHDPAAVLMHEINHPATRHFTADVFEVDPVLATKSRPVGLLWASPDCKHFSRAKGAKPVEKKIRALAWVVIKWAAAVRPRVICLENVREFADWGPLTKENRPCPKRKGLTFRRWVGRLKALGYEVETRVLNAADYGAPTNRKRLFLVARCDGCPIKWPEPTHGKGRPKPYRAAAECIDWLIPCPSIFLSKEEAKKAGVRRPLAEKTLRRIAMGIKRYVLESAKPFIVQVNHGGHDSRTQSIEEPLGTVTGSHGHALVTPFVAGVSGRAGQSPETSGDSPLGTITAKNDRAIITPILVQRNGEAPHQETRGIRVDQPFGTITPREGGGYNLVAPCMARIGNTGGNGPYCGSATDPIPTIVSKNQELLVSAFLAKHFGGVVGVPMEDPAGTITARDHHGVVAANLIHMNHGEKQWSDPSDPLRTVTSNNHAGLVYAFLSKYFGTAIGSQLSEPTPTATGKHRFALVTVTIGGEEWVIVDIGMRMLTPEELAMAQGFPSDYVWIGSKAKRVSLIGNSVVPAMAEAIVKANYRTMKVSRPTKQKLMA